MSKINYRCLTISTGDGVREIDQEMGQYRRRYTIKVVSDATGATREFRFWDSVHNEQRGKVGLDSDELLFAFYCVLTDAQIGADTFDAYCDEWDIGGQSAKDLHRTWRECVKAAEKVRSLFHNAPDIDGMVDELREMVDR